MEEFSDDMARIEKKAEALLKFFTSNVTGKRI